MDKFGAVLIGRNEGQRLRDCLESLRVLACPMVYVDSGSSDGSQAAAQSEGALVIELDLSMPFTAARARNAGFWALCRHYPEIEFVQFIDGDCVLNAGWPAAALATFREDPRLAVVCGRRRERYPEASPYNLLCDMEWDTPIGTADSCGGDALMRRDAFAAVGGFNECLIAGEEPELCLRLRQAGWTIRRIDAEMTLHDAAMNRLGQWRRRAVRAGHAYAENSWLHWADGMWRRECWSICFWGLAVPLLALAGAYFTSGLSLLLFLAYPALMLKIFVSRRRRMSASHAALFAASCVAAKFPQAAGFVTYHWNRLRRRQSGLIEYKGPASRPST